MTPRIALALPLTAVLGGCVLAGGAATPDPGPSARSETVRLGEVTRTLAIPVRPTAVLDDSRCPANVRCVWAGRVRISAQLGTVPAQTVELELGRPDPRADHGVELVGVEPGRTEAETIAPSAYRFRIREKIASPR